MAEDRFQKERECRGRIVGSWQVDIGLMFHGECLLLTAYCLLFCKELYDMNVVP